MTSPFETIDLDQLAVSGGRSDTPETTQEKIIRYGRAAIKGAPMGGGGIGLHVGWEAFKDFWSPPAY